MRAIRWMAMVGSAGLLALLVFEVMLRSLWPELFPEHEVGLHVAHPVLGHVLAPDHEMRIVRPEYVVTHRSNSKGFRGTELAPRSGNTVRILCLGDWLTWGEGVNDDETYPVLLEAALRAKYPDRDVQVINAGVPQYGPLDELTYFELIGPELQPDIVILQFYAGDDFEQSGVSSLERNEWRDGGLHQKESFNRGTEPLWLAILTRLKHQSHAVHWISERVGNLAMQANLLATLEQASSTHYTNEQAARVQDLLAKVQAAGTRVGARVLFVFAPEKMQVLSRPHERLRGAAFVERVATQVGAAFVDLTPPLLAEPDLDRIYLPTVGTWRAPGYQLAAEALSDELSELGWIESND